VSENLSKPIGDDSPAERSNVLLEQFAIPHDEPNRASERLLDVRPEVLDFLVSIERSKTELNPTAERAV
jgi:hypothetical protein